MTSNDLGPSRPNPLRVHADRRGLTIADLPAIDDDPAEAQLPEGTRAKDAPAIAEPPKVEPPVVAPAKVGTATAADPTADPAEAAATTVVPARAAAHGPQGAPREKLSRNEVAAVSMDRDIYVSDVPSPYLSSRQAREDVQQTKRRHTAITTVLTILFVIVALVGSGFFIWQTYMTQVTMPEAAQYETVTIERGEFVETLDSTALVQPIRSEAVASEVSGTVTVRYVEEGAYVTEGDVLLELENPTVTDALNKAQAAMDSAQADFDARVRALDEANANVDRLIEEDNKRKDAEAKAIAEEEQRLSQTNANGDQSQTQTRTTRTVNQNESAALTEARTKARTAESDVDAAQATLDTIAQTLERAQEQADRLTVHAPISGVVTDVNPQSRAKTPISGATRLCVISDISSYIVQVEVPSGKLGRARDGQEVRISFPSLPDLTVNTTVEWVSTENTDDRGPIYLAAALINEPDDRITSGMAADVSIIMQSIPDSLIVPLHAIRTNEADGSTYLEVLVDSMRGITTQVPVSIVATNDTQAAIIGDSVQPGLPVVPPAPAPEEG